MKTGPGIALRVRDAPRPSDAAAVRRIVTSSGFFSGAEVEVAVELVQERLSRGLASGYRFLFADLEDPPTGVAGYTCFGEIPCTVGSYDLYWIAVDEALRGRGVGAWLLEQTEARIRDLSGRRIYVETSGRGLYEPTQRFYVRCGYHLQAQLDDFYAEGDPKRIYVKAL